MFKYFVVLAVAGLIIYGSQHPELLGLLDQTPNFKVWVSQTGAPGNRSVPYDILNVQSREQKPILVKRVVMNDESGCVNMKASITYHADRPVKLGEVLSFALGVHGLDACDPVKVLISTDRGDTVYNFD